MPRPRGSSPGYRRPALVIQADSFNASAIATVLVAGMTANLERALAAGNVLCRRRATGLPKDAVVNVSQLIALDRRDLREWVGDLDGGKMREVDAGLRLILGL